MYALLICALALSAVTGVYSQADFGMYSRPAGLTPQARASASSCSPTSCCTVPQLIKTGTNMNVVQLRIHDAQIGILLAFVKKQHWYVVFTVR